ncbi:MAG: VOC family protein [Pseudomonadota bacterium]
MTTAVVRALDHLVLTVADIAATVEFYTRHLGMEAVVFGAEERVALSFGAQKINLHQAGAEFLPHARAPLPGSADLCFLSDLPVEAMKDRLEAAGVPVELGPVARTGARLPLRSIYLRDPDGNLIEIANEL